MKKQKAPDLFLCNKRNPVNAFCQICVHSTPHQTIETCDGKCKHLELKCRCIKQKKSRKLPETPNTQIRAALRKLFLRSRERAVAKKRCNSSCVICGKKESKARGKEVKVEVHHKGHVCNWQKIFEVVRECLLCSPDLMEVLCGECHKELHQLEEVK